MIDIRKPQLRAIWCFAQDDGFGNMIEPANETSWQVVQFAVENLH